MPEGPEVKKQVDLLRIWRGKVILDIGIVSGRYTRSYPVGYQEFLHRLPLNLTSVNCYGKFIYFTLSNEEYIWNTLGMSGRWSLKPSTHERLVFTLRGGTRLHYCDSRNFGTFHFGMSKEDTKHKVSKLGLDFLDANNNHGHEASLALFQKKRNQRKTLAQILMDQKNYAGVGNYIKAEALYRARLSPHRLGNSLDKTEIMRLHNAIQNIMLHSYHDPDFTKVIYKREKCPEGNAIVGEETLDKRITYWVPSLQK